MFQGKDGLLLVMHINQMCLLVDGDSHRCFLALMNHVTSSDLLR